MYRRSYASRCLRCIARHGQIMNRMATILRCYRCRCCCSRMDGSSRPLDVLWKNVQHQGGVYLAGGLSAVVTDATQRGRGFGRQIVRAAREEIGTRGADLGLFTCDPPLQRFYELAGWRTLIGTVLVGGTPDRPLPSDREGKITMGYFYSTSARERADAFIGARIALYPGEIDKLW